jgi:hypothetical protein
VVGLRDGHPIGALLLPHGLTGLAFVSESRASIQAGLIGGPFGGHQLVLVEPIGAARDQSGRQHRGQW